VSHVTIEISRDDPIRVTFRPDLRPERGGIGFLDIGVASFLLDADQLAELRDAITHALDNQSGGPGGDPS